MTFKIRQHRTYISEAIVLGLRWVRVKDTFHEFNHKGVLTHIVSTNTVEGGREHLSIDINRSVGLTLFIQVR